MFALAYVVNVGTYWGAGLAFLAIDLMRPGWSSYFKCQPDKHVTMEMVKKCVKNIVTNQLSTNLITFVAVWPIAKNRLSFSAELPAFTELLWSLAAYAMITEVTFYYSHRMLHIPKLYKLCHKEHHEIKAPFAICALYFHPLEHVTSVLQAIIPALVCKSHLSIALLWICMATFNVLLHHCGYDFEPYWPDSLQPFFKSMTQQHDYHHYAFDKCFGVIGVLDWLHGTDAGFTEHYQKWEKAREKEAPKLAASKLASAKDSDASSSESNSDAAKKPEATNARKRASTPEPRKAI